MTGLFLYGTLRHRPLLETVLGRPVDPRRLVRARLAGHAVHEVADASFPVIRPADSVAEGVLLRDPSAEEAARLDFFEGGFAYALKTVTVATDDGDAQARAYFPEPGHVTPAGPFDLDAWIARWGATYCAAAEEVMARFGRQSAQHVARLAPFIRARAWAPQLARPAPASLRDGGEPDALDLQERGPGWEGFFRVRPVTVRHRRFDGTWSPPLEREIVASFDVALVLPYDPESDKVLLIEQLRFGPVGRGDARPLLLEPVAGFIEAGEDPRDAARREAEEEARLAPRALVPMTQVYASPGYSTEFFHCFLAICDLAGRSRDHGGLEAEHEDIRNHTIPFAQAMALLDSGEINAGPLAMMLLWLARQRERFRPSA